MKSGMRIILWLLFLFNECGRIIFFELGAFGAENVVGKVLLLIYKANGLSRIQIRWKRTQLK